MNWYRPTYVVDVMVRGRWSLSFRSPARAEAAARFAVEKQRLEVAGLLLWLDRPGQPSQLLLSWYPEPGRRRWFSGRPGEPTPALRGFERRVLLLSRPEARSGLRRALAGLRWLVGDVRRAWKGGVRLRGGRAGW
jgi:hypothetical protein